MALSFIKMLNSGLLHLTGGFIVYYAWVLTISLRCDNWYFSCGKMIIMEMKLSEHYVIWCFIGFFWLRCETKFIMANPYPFICSVALISLQGLTFVLDKTCGFSFHDQYLKNLKLNPIDPILERCWKIFFQRNYI